jgi:hypothetical protein
VSATVRRDCLQVEAVAGQRLHHRLQRGLVRADVRDHVAVLADLGRDLPMLERVQQHHLPADEGPPDRQRTQIQQQVPQLVDR